MRVGAARDGALRQGARREELACARRSGGDGGRLREMHEMRETRGDQASSGGDLTRRGSDLLLYAFPRRLDDAAHLPGGGRRRQKGSEGVNRQMKASDVIRRHPTPSDAIRRHPTPSEGSRRNLRASRAPSSW